MRRAGAGEGWIRSVPCTLAPPSLKDNTADADRLKRGLQKALQGAEVTVGLPLIRRLPTLLRSCGYKVYALLYRQGESWRLFEVLPGTGEPALYGLAVDLGSSTVAVRLLDLTAQETIDEVSFHNPQNQIGLDILTRIHFASKEGGLRRLQDLLVERLNREIKGLAERRRIPAEAIVGMSVAGNTTMTHLFLGLDPHWMCREPYIPALNRPPIFPSGQLEVAIHPEAPVLVFPNVGSYFGGDLIAGVLASGMGRREEVAILVDVGTNAEVVLGNREWLVACAGAAGPALEGGVANMGMMAGPGVIDKVSIEPDSKRFLIRTIEDKPPVGICGSGLIDLAAHLFLAGMIDLQGKFVGSECGERLREVDGVEALVVVPSHASGTGRNLTISQPDLDALIRSKAAMFAILTTITRMVHIPMKDLARFYIAGTFGSFIDPQSAITLGMIPDLPLDTYRSLGNTSLEGAARALLSAAAREEIYEIHDRITYVELNVNQEFMNLFSAARFIPHTDRALFPSVRPLPG